MSLDTGPGNNYDEGLSEEDSPIGESIVSGYKI